MYQTTQLTHFDPKVRAEACLALATTPGDKITQALIELAQLGTQRVALQLCDQLDCFITSMGSWRSALNLILNLQKTRHHLIRQCAKKVFPRFLQNNVETLPNGSKKLKSDIFGLSKDQWWDMNNAFRSYVKADRKNVQSAACLALAQRGEIGVLIRQVESDNLDIRRPAFEALMQAPKDKFTADQLMTLANHWNWMIREVVAKQLRYFAGPEVTKTLQLLTDDKNKFSDIVEISKNSLAYREKLKN